MHSGSENKVPLVYVPRGPLRPVVDRKILKFALAHAFRPGDFAINNLGGCRLNPQMAKVVASQVAGLSASCPLGVVMLEEFPARDGFAVDHTRQVQLRDSKPRDGRLLEAGSLRISANEEV
jgi:hypothetical protein